ncbi:uncharacterized protein AKAME5_002263800 [Lates japonicus]|uniref:SGNH hydrolase-type esterase domain-containing protein n=1 Tax=Lates japonicus TaxID=270547 RepID=A0AAD3NGA5_LATJO|nr:uncharacterized protein AKAME5_002263800 [Lates japonicus]
MDTSLGFKNTDKTTLTERSTISKTPPYQAHDPLEEWLMNPTIDTWEPKEIHKPQPQRTPRKQTRTKRAQTPPGPSNLDQDLDELIRALRETTEPFLFTRHEHRGDKTSNWLLKPQRPFIIMGDSNMARLPCIPDTSVQVDCYPGANIANATHILKNKTPTSPETNIVILSFGLNNRNQGNPTLLRQAVTRLIKTAKDTFPFAKIYIPLISFSEHLHIMVQRNIRELNHILKESDHHIPRLPHPSFKTNMDRIHWTPETGEAMWKLWKTFLGLTPCPQDSVDNPRTNDSPPITPTHKNKPH